jgi:hypothetical protein
VYNTWEIINAYRILTRNFPEALLKGIRSERNERALWLEWIELAEDSLVSNGRAFVHAVMSIGSAYRPIYTVCSRDSAVPQNQPQEDL